MTGGNLNLRRIQRVKGLTRKTVNGFTLIEMAIVITIAAVIASIAIPSYINFVERGKLAAGTEALISLRSSMEQAYQAHRSYRNGDNCLYI